MSETLPLCLLICLPRRKSTRSLQESPSLSHRNRMLSCIPSRVQPSIHMVHSCSPMPSYPLGRQPFQKTCDLKCHICLHHPDAKEKTVAPCMSPVSFRSSESFPAFPEPPLQLTPVGPVRPPSADQFGCWSWSRAAHPIMVRPVQRWSL